MTDQQNDNRVNKVKQEIRWVWRVLKPRVTTIQQLTIKRPLLSGTTFFSLMIILYWGVIASDRYISVAHVIIQNTDKTSSQMMDLGSMLGGLSSGGGSGDQLLLRDYLLSVDMLHKAEKKLELRAHYSLSDWDLFSRMWDKNQSIEWFHQYYLSRVSIELDETAGVLVIESQAYTPEKAHAITSLLVNSGEQFMNKLARDLAKVQVDFLDDAVIDMSNRVLSVRQQVLDFQNKKGLVSPENATENLVGIINGMETKVAELQTHKSAMLSYLMPSSPKVVEVNMQIAALKRQIYREKSKLTSPSGKTLNKTVEEYERLQINATFAQDLYKSAIQSLEMGRLETARTLKKMSVLQKPSVPEYPLQPRRLYNITAFILCTILISGIISLLSIIIRDHKD